jgi:hypothetical protein
MNLHYGWLVIGLLVGELCFAPVAVGGARADGGSDRGDAAAGLASAEPEQADPPLEGFWPTDRLIELAVRRWCGQVAYDYHLDEEQTANLEEMMLRRWPRWLEENRRSLQPLVNEFMENRLALEPPSPERVSDWAGRAARMFDSMREELRAAQADFREWLTPAQKMQFDADVMKMNVGMELFEQKLRGWQAGQYARRELWKQPEWERRAEREAERQSQADALAGADSREAEQPSESDAVPLDKWESYVVAFIKDYALDPEQITSAWRIMGDLRARAERYKERHRDEYARLESKLAEAADAQQKEALIARRRELDQPLAQLFEELQVRLDRLLTNAQRGAVSDRHEITTPASSTDS